MNKKTYFFLVALIMVFVFCGSSAVTAADPTNNTINGTITIKEYNTVKNLTNATVTVNNSGKILGTAKTDQNGYYSINFFSNQTKFNVTANFVGCNLTNQTVTIAKGVGSDPNYYGTANIQLTPNTIWWTGTMGPSTKVYIQHYGGYYSAGQLQVTMDRVNFYYAYCIDIYTGIGPNDLLLVNGPLPGTRGDLNSSINWAKVNYILNHYDPSKNTTDDARNLEGAAIQCAIWYFTSANYGVYPGNNTYYQFMTYNRTTYGNPYDGYLENNLLGSRHTVANRAWAIIRDAIAMQYPATIELSPETSNLENGGSLNLTGIVKDQNGNPLNNITVNFTTTSGTFNATSAVTDAFGRVKVSITGLTSNITSLVTASVTGSYGNLLYDNPLNPKQNLVAANLLPFTLSDTSYINCNPKANVTLSQTVNSPVNVGDTVTYIVTANNRGPNAATNIVISDVIPASLANVTVTPSVGTYNSSTGLWIIPTLNNGASATLTITGKATVAMAGLNTTNVATRIAQDQYNQESNTTSAKVYTKKANVTLSETVNSPVNVGGLVTYIVTALNNGPDNATNIVISNVLPAALAGFTVTPSVGTYNSGVWTIPNLANGASATLSIVGNATAAMAGLNTTNTATQTGQTEYSSQYNSSNATVYTKKTDIVLTQTVNGGTVAITRNVGQAVTFVVTARNNGPDNATNINIQNILPGLTGLTATPGTGTTYNSATGVWTIPSLKNGSIITLTLSGLAGTNMAGLNTTNIATVTNQTEYDPTPATNTSAKVYTKLVDIRITQTTNIPDVKVGSDVIFRITVTNHGPDTATTLRIADLLPYGVNYRSNVRSTGTYSSSTGVWSITTLNRGASATLNITARPNATTANSWVTNWANQTSQTEYDPVLDKVNASVYVYNNKANVALSQTVNGASNATVNVGDTVTFVVTARNNGPDTATNVLISDLIPEGLTDVLVTTQGGSYNSTNRVWTITSLINGNTASLTITGKSGPSMAGLNITNNATRTSQSEYNSLPVLTNATVYTKFANVTVTNTATNSTLNVGNNGVFTVVVTNNGPDAATNIKLTDLIPGFTGTVTMGSYDNTTGIWTIPSLANGTSATLTLSGMITAAMAGTNITSHVTETQTEYPFNTTAPDATTYIKKANVVLSEVVNSPVNVGGLVSYVVTALNNGPDNATNIVISDVLPAVLAGFTVTPSVGTYNSGVWTIPSLASGVSATLSIVGNATAAMAGLNTTNTATQTGQTEFSDLYTSANATVYTKLADTKLSQTVTTPVNVGGTVTYVVTITNTGPDTATNFIIQDNVPAGLANYTVTPSTGTYLNGNWTIFSLANGESATLTITGKATAVMAGKNTTNTATKITETEYDPTTIG